MKPAQILFVDDDLMTAKAFADLVERKTRFTTVACDLPDDALRIVKDEPISVVVLDQKMPLMSGTDLYREMLKIRPNVKAIMLSGVAEREDVSNALDLHYVADVRKDLLDDLIPAVQKAYVQYLRASGESLERPIFLMRRGLPVPLTPRIEYFIDSIEETSSTFIPDGEWQHVIQINAGQSIEREELVEVSRELILENSFESGAESSGGINSSAMVKIEANLKSFIKSSLKSVAKNSSRSSLRTKETYSLPPEPGDPSLNAVMARSFYIGAEFIRVRIGLIKKFLPFDDVGYCWLDIAVHTGRFARKQVDTLRDGSRVERVTASS